MKIRMLLQKQFQSIVGLLGQDHPACNELFCYFTYGEGECSVWQAQLSSATSHSMPTVVNLYGAELIVLKTCLLHTWSNRRAHYILGDLFKAVPQWIETVYGEVFLFHYSCPCVFMRYSINFLPMIGFTKCVCPSQFLWYNVHPVDSAHPDFKTNGMLTSKLS